MLDYYMISDVVAAIRHLISHTRGVIFILRLCCLLSNQSIPPVLVVFRTHIMRLISIRILHAAS